jgi:hypothetical protein
MQRLRLLGTAAWALGRTGIMMPVQLEMANLNLNVPVTGRHWHLSRDRASLSAGQSYASGERGASTSQLELKLKYY